MAKVYCSILQVSNRILRDRLISNYFENTKSKSNKPARGIEKIGNCVNVYHVPPYVSREMRKSFEINGCAKPQNEIQNNVAILLVNLDGVHVLPEEIINTTINSERALRDDKVPVVVICTTKEQDQETRRKVDYNNLSSQNNQFVFVMPTLVLPPTIVQKVVDPSIPFGDDDTALLRDVFGSSLDLSFSIGMLLSPSYDMKHLIQKYPSFANALLHKKYPTPDIDRVIKSKNWRANIKGSKIEESDSAANLIESPYTCIPECEMNIAHLVSKMSLGWGVNRLIDNFSESQIFELFSECDTRFGQTPLMFAAIDSKDSTLTAFLNFYSCSIKMNELNGEKNNEMTRRLDSLLHKQDNDRKTLVYYITDSEEKCLGPYGSIMQFEKKFHVRDTTTKEGLDFGYSDLNRCFHDNLGSSQETSRALRLLNDTKSSSEMMLLTLTCSSILSVLMFPMMLYIGDVVLDSLVAVHYYSLWTNGSMPETDCSKYHLTSLNVTLEDYPVCLTYGWKFAYTVIFIGAPFIFSFHEIVSNHLKWTMEKLDWLLLLLLPFSVVFWPCILLVLKTVQLNKYHRSKGAIKQEHKKRCEQYTNRFVAVHFKEVCIESSFNALLQWYILLPAFLVRYHNHTLSIDVENTYLLMASTSFFLSIVSLAWSLTANIAQQKKGALDMTWAPVPRLILFISNLLLVFARINSFVVFMYYWGPGKFYPGMIAILLHVLIMMVIHMIYLEQKRDKKEKKVSFRYLRHLIYVCFIYGFTNIMVSNFMELALTADEELGRKPKNTRGRRLFTTVLFFIENVLLVCFGYIDGETLTVYPLDQDVCIHLLFGVFILFCTLAGVLLKLVYYKFFHIWKEIRMPPDDGKKRMSNYLNVSMLRR